VVFGSYGWGGESIKDLEKIVAEMGLELLKTFKVQYIPDESALESIKNELLSVL